MTLIRYYFCFHDSSIHVMWVVYILTIYSIRGVIHAYSSFHVLWIVYTTGVLFRDIFMHDYSCFAFISVEINYPSVNAFDIIKSCVDKTVGDLLNDKLILLNFRLQRLVGSLIARSCVMSSRISLSREQARLSCEQKINRLYLRTRESS